MQSVVENFLSKEVTRREFLALVVSGLLSIFGVTALLKRLSGSHHVAAPGYGDSAYGGVPEIKQS